MARDKHGHELPAANTTQRYGQEIRLPDFIQNMMPEETPPSTEVPQLNKAEFAQVLHENPQMPQEPDDSYLSRIMDTAIPMALRILPAIGGSIIGGLGGSIPGLMAGGAAGSGFGEGLAQAYETSRGLREDFNPQQVAMQSFLGGIPLGAGKIASTGRLAAQSGLLGGGSTIGTSLAETGEMPSVPEFLMGTGLGTVMGAGAGKLAQRPMRNVAAGDPPFQGMMDFEDVTGAMPSPLRRGIEPQYAVDPQQQGLNVQTSPAQEMGLPSLQQNTAVPLSSEDLLSTRLRTEEKLPSLTGEFQTPSLTEEFVTPITHYSGQRGAGVEMGDVQPTKVAKLTTKQRKEQERLTNVIRESNKRLNHLMVEHLKWEQGVKGAKPLPEEVQRGLQKKIDDATTKLEGRIEHVEVASDLPADARVTETGAYGTPVSAEGPPVAQYSGPTRSDTGEWIDPVKSYQTRVPVPGDPDYAGPVLNIRTDKQPSLFEEPISVWETAAQKLTSKATSINETKTQGASRVALHHGEWSKGTPDRPIVNADIGGGESDFTTIGIRNLRDDADPKYVENHVWDPYNRTPEHNQRALEQIKHGQADTATVSSVLNVVKERGARDRIIRQAADAIKEDGTAYIVIHEGSGTGKFVKGVSNAGAETDKIDPETGLPSWQNNAKPEEYLPEIKKYFGYAEVENIQTFPDSLSTATKERKIKVIVARNPLKNKVPIKKGRSPFFGATEQQARQKAATEVTPIVARNFRHIRGHDSSDIAKARRDANLGGEGAPPPRSDELNDLAGRGIEGLAWYKELGAKGIAAIYGIDHPITRLYTRILAATSPARAVYPDNINAAAQVTERIRMNPDEATLAPLGITSGAGAKKNIQRVLDDFYENTGLTSRKLEARKVGGFDAALTDSLDIAAGRKPTGGMLTREEAVIDRHMMAVYGFDPSKQGALKKLYHGGAENPKQLAKFWRDVFTDDNGKFHKKLWERHTKPATGTTKSHGNIVATKGTEDRVGTLYDFIAGDIEMKAMSAADNIKVIDGKGAERSLREIIGRQLDVHEYQSMVWNGVRTKSQAGGAYENPARLVREQYSDPNIPLPMGERTTKLAEGVKRIPTLSKLDEMPASGYAGEGRPTSDAGARTGDVLGMRISGATESDRQLVDEVVNAALSPKARAGKKDGWVNYRIGYDKGSEAYSATSIKPKDPSRYIASQSRKRQEAFRKHELVYDEPLKGTGKPEEIKKILNNFLYNNTHILTQMTEARPSAQRPFLRVKYTPPKKGKTGRLQFEVAREGTGDYTYKE